MSNFKVYYTHSFREGMLMKKRFAVLWICALCLGLLLYNLFGVPNPQPLHPSHVPPGKITHSQENSPKPEPLAQVRIRNTDPALQTAWERLARQYSESTGVDVVVSGENDPQAPTLFSVVDESEIDAENCQDLSSTEAFGQLADMGLALKVDGKYCGIAMEIHCFGLIFNENLLAEMVTQEEIQDINGFSALVQAIVAKGYSPFAGRSLSDGVATRLASIPGSYRTLAQLWGTNPTEQTEQTPLERFLSGEAVFYLGSTWEYDAILSGGIDAMGILPIFLDQGQTGYVRQSLCITPQSYWCVNAAADERDVAATLDFLNWMVQPMEDGTVPVDSLEILAPYRQAKYYANPLENTLRMDLSAGKTPVVCKNLTAPPSGFIEALTAFAQDPTDETWKQVEAFLQKNGEG